MTYKDLIKKDELVTKIRIIKQVKQKKLPITAVAQSFQTHRNTIHNILRVFEKRISPQSRDLLLKSKTSLSQRQLEESFPALLNQKRAPKTHKRKAGLKAEETIVKLFTEDRIRIGIRQMKTFLMRRFGKDHSLAKLTLGQLKGIYVRNNLSDVHTPKGKSERRALYDYKAITAFAYMHLDVKDILDKKTLPPAIYHLLSHNSAPVFQWNLMEVKSRFRFLAYSYGLNAEFGFRFLLFTLLYIRYALHNEDIHITTGVDNGLEFCRGSQRKLEEWNRHLKVLNAHLYQYEPYFDIRKNLLERSHRSDDELQFVPRGIYMTDKQSFHKEVTGFARYWNTGHAHHGIEMHGATPAQALKKLELTGVDRLTEYPVLILEDSIADMRECTKLVEFEAFAEQNPDLILRSKTDQKVKREIEDKFFLSSDAQNVLTYYHNRVHGI
jgi:hypothetical protein